MKRTIAIICLGLISGPGIVHAADPPPNINVSPLAVPIAVTGECVVKTEEVQQVAKKASETDLVLVGDYFTEEEPAPWKDRAVLIGTTSTGNSTAYTYSGQLATVPASVRQPMLC